MIPGDQAAHLFAWAQANDLALFPILKGSKQPTGIVHSHASDWSKEIARWWEWYHTNQGCNFGVSCGPSNLIVVDVDLGGEEKFNIWRRDNLNLYLESTVNTPTGGKHYYFKVPPGVDSETLRQPNLCGKEVNVRAGRGYVVAPWSYTDPVLDPHVKARGYYRLNNPRILTAHPILVEHCSPSRDEAPAIVPEAEYDLDADGMPTSFPIAAEVDRRLRGALERFGAAVPGERNERLNQAAFDLGKIVAEGKIAEWKAIELLQEAGERLGIPRDEAKARSTIRSGLKAAPKVGQPEPKSAMLQLLAAAVPMAPIPPLAPRKSPSPDSLVPIEPLVERLLYPGNVTILSGQSGSGKTTFLASLMAASAADARDFRFGDFGANASDLLMFPCCWIFLSYEGGQHIKRTTAAWHVGAELEAKYPDRVRNIALDDGTLISTVQREIYVNESQARTIDVEIAAMKTLNPSMPIVLVVDNLTSAVEDSLDIRQAQRFIMYIKAIARQDISVVVLAHPPKSGSSTIYGSHVFNSLGDIVCNIDVLKAEDGEWVQWIEFTKHRDAPNGQCLEVRSSRIKKPLYALPAGWGGGNDKARSRAEKEAYVPYVTSIRVRNKNEKDGVLNGASRIDNVTDKPSEEVRI